MTPSKRVLFLMESSPTAHLRFFEGLRMALGFSVSHSPVTVLLAGEGVRILLPLQPLRIGLPPEIVEVLPLLQELKVRVLACEESWSRFGEKHALPSFVQLVDRAAVTDLFAGSEIVIPFLRRTQ